jgi:small-conductance mechanosensitive channel
MDTGNQGHQFLNETAERRTLKKKHEEVSQEVKLANKALIQIRRSQLRKLIDQEKHQYLHELQGLGLSYYTERL